MNSQPGPPPGCVRTAGGKRPGMKTPSACVLLIAGLSCAVAARADDSWRSKPPSDWSQKEIRQILERSPWARRVSVLLVRPEGEAKPCAGSKGPCQREETFHPPDTSNASLMTGRRSPDLVTQTHNTEIQQEYSGAGAVDQPEATDGVTGIAVVRWASAHTVREALARLVTPSGKRMDAAELAALVPPDAYVVYVDLRVALADVPRVPQSGVFTESIARRSTLELKSTGRRISAARVTKAPLPEFDERKELALGAYYIFFSRQERGRDALPPGESEVRFECPLARVPIRADFRISRMAPEGVPDL